LPPYQIFRDEPKGRPNLTYLYPMGEKLTFDSSLQQFWKDEFQMRSPCRDISEGGWDFATAVRAQDDDNIPAAGVAGGSKGVVAR